MRDEEQHVVAALNEALERERSHAIALAPLAGGAVLVVFFQVRWM